jgi:hypothetical protein
MLPSDQQLTLGLQATITTTPSALIPRFRRF